MHVSIVKGNAKDASWRTLLLKMAEVDRPAPALGWSTRVPSSSNIVDGPSWGLFDRINFVISFVMSRLAF